MAADTAKREIHRPIALAAAFLFFLAAVAYCCLEVHSSTDTWIGLASGRQIAGSATFPINDTFSFTAAGQPSYNQNWLTHRIQYWFYSTLGPDSVVYAHWATILAIHLLIAAATWWRTRSLLAALVTGGIVAFAFRDYLSARPATMGFLCMATVWAMLCALGSRRDRTPWWPIPILGIALLVWGQVHGSFSFGFAFVGLFIAQAVLLRLVFRAPDSRVLRIPTPQIVALAAVLAIGVAGSVLLSPFGLENLKHGEKIRASEIFRHVSEWYPPLGDRPERANVTFPPVWRFGTALEIAGVLVLLAGALRLIWQATALPLAGPKKSAPELNAGARRPIVSNLVFDLVILGLTISMTLWARRFGPVLVLFAGPIVATWIVELTSRVDGFWRRVARIGVACGALAGAIPLAVAAGRDVRDKLITPFADAPEASLLDRYTETNQSPLAEIEFLKRNEITGRVFCEWTEAAMVMWHHPDAKVFMDGRAQQLYDEQMFLAYVAIDLATNASAGQIMDLIDGKPAGNVRAERPPVDIVIIRLGKSRNLHDALDQQVGKTWVLVYSTGRGFVYMRKDSDPFRSLAARLKDGREWRPETADAIATRGEVFLNLTPPDPDAAMRCFKAASAADPVYVAKTMPVIMRIEREAGRLPALLEYIDAQIARFSGSVAGLSEDQVRAIRGQLGRWRELTIRAMNSQPGNPADKTP